MKKLLTYTIGTLFSFSLWAQGGITTPSPGVPAAGTPGGSGTINTTPPPATGTDQVIQEQEAERTRRRRSSPGSLGTGNTPNGTGAQSGQGIGTGIGTGTGTGTTTPATTPTTTPSP